MRGAGGEGEGGSGMGGSQAQPPPRQTRLPPMGGGSGGGGGWFGGGGGAMPMHDGAVGAVAAVDEDLLGFTPRTAEVLMASKREAEALETLHGLFPALPMGELRATLERLEWDVNVAACELIDWGLQS